MSVFLYSDQGQALPNLNKLISELAIRDDDSGDYLIKA